MHDYPHFLEEKLASKELSYLPKIAQLRRKVFAFISLNVCIASMSHREECHPHQGPHATIHLQLRPALDRSRMGAMYSGSPRCEPRTFPRAPAPGPSHFSLGAAVRPHSWRVTLCELTRFQAHSPFSPFSRARVLCKRSLPSSPKERVH